MPFALDPFQESAKAYVRNLLFVLSRCRLTEASLTTLFKTTLVKSVLGAPSDGAAPDPAAWMRERLSALAAERYPTAIPACEEPTRSNLRVLAETFELDSTDLAVLTFLIADRQCRPLGEVFQPFETELQSETCRLIASALGLTGTSALTALAPRSRLLVSGLVVSSEHLYDTRFSVVPRHGLVDLTLADSLSRDDFFRRYLEPASAPSLVRDDFAPIADKITLAARLLAGAVEQRRVGVNVLLYGSTGTGKTELARLLAKEAQAPLFAIGKTDDQGDSPEALERLSSLRLANRLVRSTRALLLFDECEDLFEWTDAALRDEGRAGIRFSKQWFNDLLETNAVPTIWVTNVASGIDPAYLRRFAYAIEVGALGPKRRAAALARHLGPTDAIDSGAVERIAQRFEAPPALLSAAVANARLASPDGRARSEVVEGLLEPMHDLTTGRRARRGAQFDPDRFRLDCLNPSSALPEPTPDSHFSMCLYGPPGTGKSELARWYAWRLDRPVVERRASDILSMWVGETEKNIARAFREAADEGAVLVFDEVDSVLRDRARADHSWEATQVNELLQQLESFRGIAICTTNLLRDLDPAALRRFVFKIELRPLTPSQAVTLFERELAPLCDASAKATSAIDAVSALPRLTAGDFAAVRRRLTALGRRVPPDQIVGELEAELRTKRAPTMVRGFGA